MGRKKRSTNNNVKRERFAVKELARLKKCLGIADDKKTDVLEKVADISTPTTAKEIKKKQTEDILDIDMEESTKKEKKVKVTNEKTGVVHIYDPKTKKDQFGNYPIWHNRQAEKKKKRTRKPDGTKKGKKRLTKFTINTF